MLQMLIFLGVMNAAYIYPIALGIFWRKLNKDVTFMTTIASMILGYAAYFAIGALEGVVVAGWVSLLGCVIGSLKNPENFDWERLKKIGAPVK
jgi:Na+/pantothenate symporter